MQFCALNLVKGEKLTIIKGCYDCAIYPKRSTLEEIQNATADKIFTRMRNEPDSSHTNVKLPILKGWLTQNTEPNETAETNAFGKEETQSIQEKPKIYANLIEIKGSHIKQKAPQDIQEKFKKTDSRSIGRYGEYILPNIIIPLGKCRVNCKNLISIEQQKRLFEHYWSIKDDHHRMSYLKKLVTRSNRTFLREIRSKKIRRNNSYKYHVEIDGMQALICRSCFLRIFGESENFLKTLQRHFRQDGRSDKIRSDEEKNKMTHLYNNVEEYERFYMNHNYIQWGNNNITESGAVSRTSQHQFIRSNTCDVIVPVPRYPVIVEPYKTYSYLSNANQH